MPSADEIAALKLQADIRRHRDIIMQQEARLSLLTTMQLRWLQQQSMYAIVLLRAALAERRETLRALKVRIGRNVL